MMNDILHSTDEKPEVIHNSPFTSPSHPIRYASPRFNNVVDDPKVTPVIGGAKVTDVSHPHILGIIIGVNPNRFRFSNFSHTICSLIVRVRYNI